MADIFRVDLYPQGPENRSTFAHLKLPATPWQMQDALDKVRLREGEVLCCEILEVRDGDVFGNYLPDNPDLFQLNALAQRFSELTGAEQVSLYGLVRIEGNETISLPRLIDLAYSANRCEVIPGVYSDGQLGWFYVNEGRIETLNGLPDEARALLDYARIGRQAREHEHGLFTDSGYITQDTPIREVFSSLDLTPRVPDYAVLLKLDSGDTLRLPAPPPALLPAGGFRCVDCAVPALAQAITDSGDIRLANRFAAAIKGLEPDKLPAYKALIEAAGHVELDMASTLADGLAAYVFSPMLSSPEDVALDELKMAVDEDLTELLLPHLDLRGLGEDLIQDRGYSMTSYGLIERRDGELIQGFAEQLSTRGSELSM